MQKQFYAILICVTSVFFVSFSTIQDASAQTKVHDLYPASVSVDFSPDGRYIATGDTDGDVVLWEVGNDEWIYYRSLGGQVQGVAFSPDGRYIAADGNDGNVIANLLEKSNGAIVNSRYVDDEANNINSIAYSPNGNYVAIALDLRWTFLWDLNSGAMLGWGITDSSEVYDVAFSPDGRHLATGNDNGDLTLWELDSWWTVVNKIDFKPGGNVKTVAFSPNGKYLAADGYDGRNTSVIIYDIINNKSVRQIDPDVYEVNAIAFSPDGQYLAVGGTDPEITIYRIGTAEITSVTAITEVTTIQTSGEVYDLAWSPDGNMISDGRAVYRTPAASLPKIVFESQKIDDSSPIIGGWSQGNSNGVIEAGERIELRVTLKNDGYNTANNVQGTLLTEDSSVQIHDSSMEYGDITAGSSSSGPALLPINLGDFSFKIEIQEDATPQDILFTLKVTADNGGPWYIPITLSVVDSSVIRLAFPENLISQEAFGTNSTYFVLTATYPTLTGISEELVSYGSCTFTLHIPSNTQAFIFPIKTKEDEAIEAGVNAIISLGLGLIEIPWISTLKDLLDFYLKILDVFNDNFDLKIDLQNLVPDPERPETEIEYVVLLKNETISLKGINITVEQEYRLGDDPAIKKVSAPSKLWNFGEGWAAPTAQPITLSNYPPFQLLPSDVQDTLLRYFSGGVNVGERRIPTETSLLPNYPNPFNPETWIPYQLAGPSEITISIYTAKGQLVRKLDLGHQKAGIYQSKSRAAYWDGKNELGERVASGLYFYTLTAGEFTTTRKMLIRK